MSGTWHMRWWTAAIASKWSRSLRMPSRHDIRRGQSPCTASGRRPNACPALQRLGTAACNADRDPGFRSAIGRLLAAGRFDIVHAHDWSISSAMGPARRAGVPVVLTQHDYSHVCATKRLMRGDEVCPGPAPIACLRCASSWHGPVVGPGVVLANAIGRRARTKHVDAFVPVSSVVAVSTGLPGRSPYEVIPNFIPDDLVLDEAAPRPDGPIVFVGDLSRDKGIEVLLEAHKRLGGRPRLVLAGRAIEGDAARPSRSGGATGIARSRGGHGSDADGVASSSFRPSCPTAVRQWSSRRWPSAGRSLLPPVEGSLTWWTTG